MEEDETKNTTHQDLRDSVKGVLRGEECPANAKAEKIRKVSNQYPHLPFKKERKKNKLNPKQEEEINNKD